MEFNDVILKRRSVRDFSDRKVSETLIEYAVNIAFKAPSYNHLRQWEFILVEDSDTKAALTRTEIMLEMLPPSVEEQLQSFEESARNMYREAIPKQKRMIMEAPHVAVVVFKPKTPVDKAVRIYDINCVASVWCCIENFLLALAEQDVFGVTFIPKNTPAVKKLLGIPEELEVAAIIPFGYRKEGAHDPVQAEIHPEKHIHFGFWQHRTS